MPIYEYQCKDCGKVSEFLLGVTAENVKLQCSFCGSKNVEKIFSTSFISASECKTSRKGGGTCCGRQERCDKPPCSGEGGCIR